MLRQISWAKLKEWIAYSQLEPFEEERGDYRDAHIVSAVANMFARSARPMRDFLLKWDSGKSYTAPALLPSVREVADDGHAASMRQKDQMYMWLAFAGYQPEESVTDSP